MFTVTRLSEDFQFRVTESRNNRKRTALLSLWKDVVIFMIHHLSF